MNLPDSFSNSTYNFSRGCWQRTFGEIRKNWGILINIKENLGHFSLNEKKSACVCESSFLKALYANVCENTKTVCLISFVDYFKSE